MDERKQRLLDRLEEIGRALKNSGRGLALLGLGSVGRELDRLDAYSDLDFFVIVKPGEKRYFLDSLEWLEKVHPITFSFLNTVDGYKLLFADGIFCETAVFEPLELANIPYSGARVVWQDERSELIFPVSNALPAAAAQPPNVEWLIGEILSNLYVGLGRYRRGEKLSAARFIQGHAVDHILELAPFIEDAQDGVPDPFNRSRRFEQRYPITAAALPQFLSGYDQSPQAAQAILAFIDQEFAVNDDMVAAILALTGSP